MRCHTCGQDIPAARLAALPGTTTCVACSTVEPVKGYMSWEHKTAPELQIVSPQQFEVLKSLDRSGFSAALPLHSPNNPYLVSAEQALLAEGPETPSFQERLAAGEFEVVDPAPRTCRRCSRRAVAGGLCVDCATRWYRLRSR